MKVWIDLANSPHALVFEPVAASLEQRGAQILVTVRDHAQTLDLARERWPGAKVIGGPSPGGRLAKAAGIGARVRTLRSWARRERPDVCLSHNSYAQLAAARSLSIPAVTAMDYEHQPANHLAFRCARRVLAPAALPVATLRRQGASKAKLVRYPGLKEQLYLSRFEPDPSVARSLGVGPDRTLVVARTAPAGAAYHGGENPLLAETLKLLAAQPEVTSVVLARHPEQAHATRALGLPDVIVPEETIDALSLVSTADLFIGAGGTMTREAALLGVPTVSVFSGPSAAADRWLEAQGRLRRLRAPAELGRVARSDTRRPPEDLRRAGDDLLELFVATTAAVAGSGGRP